MSTINKIQLGDTTYDLSVDESNITGDEVVYQLPDNNYIGLYSVGSASYTITGTQLAEYNALCLQHNKYVPIRILAYYGVNQAMLTNSVNYVTYRPYLVKGTGSVTKLYFVGELNELIGWQQLPSANIVFKTDYYTNNLGNLGDISLNARRINFLSLDNTSGYTPSGDYNPATKKYVDDNASKTQVTTLPTANASNLGKILQYVGTTNNNYTNGYFYKCVSKINELKLTTTKYTSIPLDFKLDDSKYTVEISLKIKDVLNYNRIMFDSVSNSEYSSSIYYSLTNSNDMWFYYGCGGSNTGAFYTSPQGNHILKYNLYDENDVCYKSYFDGDSILNSGGNQSDDNISLFNSNGSTEEAAQVELYYFKVYDQTDPSDLVLLHNLIPALNPSTNKPSLYDTVTQTYYADTSDTMIYTPAGTVYSWEQLDTQHHGIRAAKIHWIDNAKIEDEQTLRDLQELVNEFVNTNRIPSYMVDQYSLTNMWLSGSEEWNDYKLYALEFNAAVNERTINAGRIVVYTHYNSNVIYDNTSQDYYPRFESRWGNALAYDYQLYDYLRKDNTTEYIPSDDYNPATKKYVDEVKNYALLQYSQMPTPTKAGDLIQYKGATNNNYKHSSFYVSKPSGILSPVLKINTSSSFSLSYQYQSTDRLEIKFMSTSDVGDHGVLGNEEGNYSYMEMHFNSGIFYVGTGENETSYSGYYEPNRVYKAEVNVGATNDIIINNEMVNTGVTFGSNGTLKLFDYNGNTDYRGNFYYLKIYDRTTGNLKKEWLPALDQNNIPCLYETVSQTYFYNTYDNTGNQYDEIADSYLWELDTEYLRPEIITNDQTTYTIAELKEHQLYDLGEITSLTISDVDDIYVESDIFLESGSTSTIVSLPTGYTHFGDAPTFTTASNVDTGTLDTNKKYVISVLDGVFIWKKG